MIIFPQTLIAAKLVMFNASECLIEKHLTFEDTISGAYTVINYILKHLEILDTSSSDDKSMEMKQMLDDEMLKQDVFFWTIILLIICW